MDATLWYDCVSSRLSPDLAARFVPLAPDDDTRAFLARAEATRPGWARTLALAVLRRFVSDYDAYGRLGMYEMHLASTAQFRRLLPDLDEGARLLDVGAGAGDVTACLAPLFREVVVTESSRVLRAQLASRGHRLVDHDLGEAPWPSDERFDVASALNVLDRTARPRSLLAHLRDATTARGCVMLSVPLPLRPHVHVGPRTVDPDEALPVGEGDWETCLEAFVRDVVTPAALRVERFTRVPYLSQGDAARPLYLLDAALLVCRRGP